MTQAPPSPDPPDAPSPASPAPRSRGRRVVRALAWSFGGLLALVLVLAGGAWWWLGSDQSLAAALAQAARYLPAGQTLSTREVSGSVRGGGRIGWLRYESASLAVEVREVSIGWQLAPLLRRRLQLGELHAAQVRIERRGPPDDTPPTPLEQLTLPIEVDLPFRVDDLLWSGPPAVQAKALAGRYRYAGTRHELQIDGVDLADGHYGARLQLDGAAPMALDAALDGRVLAPLGEGRSLALLARATVKGTLATSAARLQVAAQLRPAEPAANADDSMSAQVDANIAPWQAQPVIDAKAVLRNLDVAPLWPDAPETRLSGELRAGPDPATGAAAWKLAADVRNALPGPWDKGRLPLESIEAETLFDGTNWTVPEATLELGHGRVELEGRWSPAPSPWQARATVRGVRPGELHTLLTGAPVSGRVTADQRGEALAFDVALQAEGGAGASALQGLRLERVLAQGQWLMQAQALDLRTLRVVAERASLEGKLKLRVPEQAGDGELSLTAPGASAQVRGKLAPTQGDGEVKAQVDDAAKLQAWLEALPGLANSFGGASAQGSAKLEARWQGGWQAVQRRLQALDRPAARGAEPTLQATLTAPRLDLQGPAPRAGALRPVPLQLRGLRAELAGSLAQATVSLQGEATSGTARLQLDARAGGGLDRPDQWRASLASLRLVAQDSTRPGPWTVEASRAVSATVRSGANGRLDVEASAGGATLRGPVPGTVQIDWQPVRFSQSGSATARAYRLQSQGRLQGLPMAWAEAFNASGRLAELGLSGDLLFDGEWDIDAGDTLRAKARVARKSGDLRVQAGEAALVTRITSHGTGTAGERSMNAAAEGLSTPAGLRRAELGVEAQGENVRAQLAWDSERAGVISAEASTRVVQRDGGWQWPADAALAGRITARLPQLGVWSMLAPPGWRIAGTLDADATLSGDRAAPRWNGTLGADGLALRAAVEGLDLRDGRLRATLAGDRVQITEFSLKGGAASSVRIAGQSGNRSTARSEAATDGGSLDASGELRWGGATPEASGIRMDLQARLRALRVLVRSDRQLSLSGDLQTKLDGGQFTVRGKLKTERAVIILPDETAPSLGSDVVVRSAAKEREAQREAERDAGKAKAQAAQAQTAKPPDIDVNFDLGDDFAVQGRGLTTRLEGQLDIRSNRVGAPPRVTGEVRTVRGQYRAYGQQMDVETGIARFSGAVDNPALDILAIRPNITQRAGVQITGTAQSPRVRLYSEPALSDAETLSWVVLGRASAQGGAESVVLQQAALALLSGLGQRGSGASIASRFGLDEIGFKGPGSGGDVRDTAITVGKRFAQNFYLTYERSLSGTLGTLYIFYDLTQRLTLRGQAGVSSGVDLIYTVKYN